MKTQRVLKPLRFNALYVSQNEQNKDEYLPKRNLTGWRLIDA